MHVISGLTKWATMHSYLTGDLNITQSVMCGLYLNNDNGLPSTTRSGLRSVGIRGLILKIFWAFQIILARLHGSTT